MSRTRSILVWLALAALVAIPLLAAASSPLLAWRQPIYIFAGFAGIVALVLLLFQPLLAIARVPGISLQTSRQVHRWTGGALVVLVVSHVVGLWITSPPDVIDALLFSSATSFSVYGVVAMWSIFLAAGLVVMRRRIPLGPRKWRYVHMLLVTISVLGSVVHAIKIEGTMEIISKSVLCLTVLLVLSLALFERIGKN